MARIFESRQAPTPDTRAPHVATGAIVAQFGDAPARMLYEAFRAFNDAYWSGKLAAPLVLITAAKSARTLADYCPRDIHGLESRIRVSPAAVNRGKRFAVDVLLHEMIHAWQTEIAHVDEHGHRGHGPRFAAECNRIGEQLGLPPVGVKGRDGLPDCAQWPCNVRPEGYYPEPYKAPTRKPSRAKPQPEPQPQPEPRPEPTGTDWARAYFLAQQLCDADARALYEAIGDMLTQRAWDRLK